MGLLGRLGLLGLLGLGVLGLGLVEGTGGLNTSPGESGLELRPSLTSQVLASLQERILRCSFPAPTPRVCESVGLE